MCDTMVATGGATRDGAVLFAKNSDRERGEAQFLDLVPAARHAPGSRVRCSWIEIEQAPETRAVLLSRPFWCWGAEMGANDAGVVIGNEAVFSAQFPPRLAPALIGMDLVRLALERAESAAAAVEVLIALIERHGQGGNCGHLAERAYDNGFLVADAREAFVVEAIDRIWAVERCGPTRAISNILSIARPDRMSPALAADAAARGYGAAFDFGARYHDPERDRATCGRLRCDRAAALLARRAPDLTPADMMAILRDHGAAAEGAALWHPVDTVGRTICMHATDAARGGQSVASMVSELREGRPALHWVTGTSAPCTSLFRPVLLGAGLPAHGPRPTDRAEGESLWWRHEAIHRAAIHGDFTAALAGLAPGRDTLEARFAARMAEALASSGPGAAALQAEAVALCWAEADAWERALAPAAPRPGLPAAFTAAWADRRLRAGAKATPEPQATLRRRSA